MPVIISANDNMHWSVERPVLLSVIRNIINLLQISSNTQVNFFGLQGVRFQEGTTLESLGVASNNFNFNEQLEVEVDDQYDAEHLYSIMLAKAGHQSIFLDQALGVDVQPIYAPCKVTISFKYRATDVNQANRWRQNIVMLTSSYHKLFLHEVEYDYHLSEEILELIMEVWSKREHQAGYGEQAAEYFTKHLNPRAHLVSSQNGDTRAWAVKERQIEIQGYFDFTTVPEKPTREHENATVTTAFSYVFEYQKPIACRVDFPLVIHNQMIDSKYITPPDYSTIEKPRRLSWQNQAQQIFRTDIRNKVSYGYEGINIPSFDDWMPRDVLHSTVKIFTAQVAITPEDPRSLLNLKDLGEVSLSPVLIEWLESGEYMHLCRDYRSILSLTVYEGPDRLVDSDYILTENLDVVATRDLDLRKCYHVRLGLVTDVRYLKSTSIARIQARPDIGLKVANAINASIRGFSGTRRDVNKQTLSDVDYTLLTGKQLKPIYGREHIPHFITEFLLNVDLK